MVEGWFDMPAEGGKTLQQINKEMHELSISPVTSYWLREALVTAIRRDPIDMLADVEHLQALLRERLDAISEAAGGIALPAHE